MYYGTTLSLQAEDYIGWDWDPLANGEIGKIFKMKAQAVSKAGIKIEKLMKENRRIRRQVNRLISIFDA